MSTINETKSVDERTNIPAVSIQVKALAPGYVLDNRYEIVSLLGKGGMGRVYEARHVTLGELRAVKVIYGFKNADDSLVKRFVLEAQLQAKLKHPNIVAVSDAGLSRCGHRFIAMELLRGEAFDAWLDRTPLEKRDVRFINKLSSYLVQVCWGLESAHLRGIIHRDIKPSNIFLHAKESVDPPRIVPKILDFGVAKRIDTEMLEQTTSEGICGTVEYISPERIRGEHPDVRADVYSMGIVLYESLTGTTPFHGDGINSVLARAIDRKYKPPAPQKLNPHVSPKLGRICMRAIARDPQKRYSSAIEMASAMRALYQTDDGSIPLVVTGDEKRAKIWRYGLVAAALIGLLMALAVVAGPQQMTQWFAGTNAEGRYESAAITAVLRPPGVTDPGTVPAKVATVQLPVTVKTDRAPRSEPSFETQQTILPDASETASPSSTPPLATSAEAMIGSDDTAPSTPALPPLGPDVSSLNIADTTDGPKCLESRPKRRPKARVNPLEKTVVSLRDANVRQMVAEGYQALHQTQFNRATNRFEDVLAIDGKNSKARYGLGRIAVQTGHYTQAADQFNQALRSAPDNTHYRNQLGKVLKRIGKVQEALEQWHRVIAADPGNAEAARQIAKACLGSP